MREILLVLLVCVAALELALSVVSLRDQIMRSELSNWAWRLENNVGL